MSSLERRVSDLLLGVQIAGATLFGVTQTLTMRKSVQGVSLAMFVVTLAYVLLFLSIAVAAERKAQSRATRHAIASYVTWTIALVAMTAGALANGSYRWSRNDTVTTSLAFGGAFLLVAAHYVRRRTVGFENPALRTGVGVCCKSIPHLAVAVKILAEGGAGLNPIAIIAGNVTIAVRMILITLSARETMWDTNRKWLFAGETLNELTWALASLMWLRWAIGN